MLAGDAGSICSHRRAMGDRSRPQPCPVRRPQARVGAVAGPVHVDLRAPRDFRRPAGLVPRAGGRHRLDRVRLGGLRPPRGRAARRGSPPDGHVPCDEHGLGRRAGAVSRVAHDRRCHQRGRRRRRPPRHGRRPVGHTAQHVLRRRLDRPRVVGTQLERHPGRRSGPRRADRRSRVRAGGRASAAPSAPSTSSDTGRH